MATAMGTPPERIDRRLHKTIPGISGTEAPAGKTTVDRFVAEPTHLPGVSIRREPDLYPAVPDSVVEALLRDAVDYRDADAAEKAATKRKKELKDRILPIIKDYPGLRGIISEPDNAQLTAVPSEKDVMYDPVLIRKSLPTAADYHETVTETVIVEFPKPAGVSVEVIKNVIAEAIHDLGKGILRTKRATVTIEYDVNERKLASRLKALGRKLLPGARTSETEFSLVPGLADKTPASKK